MSDEFSVEFSMVSQAKTQLLELHQNKPDVAAKVFKNFINPLQSQNPAKDLRGKYKPSWKVPLGVTNPFRLALAKVYEQNDCHHYHFGHPVYCAGRDPEFPGDESAGIVHTVFKSDRKVESHTLLQVDESHPNPFTVPVHLVNDKSS